MKRLLAAIVSLLFLFLAACSSECEKSTRLYLEQACEEFRDPADCFSKYYPEAYQRCASGQSLIYP